MKTKILYPLTSFLCGLCVMGVEMSATRLLSPYFGSTNLIWTVIISLIMVGLGAGGYLGGRLADKRQTPGILYACITAGAGYIALIPLISRPVVSGGLLLVDLVGPQSGFLLAAVASCLVLFIPPIALLGVVSPYLAKLCVKDLGKTGVTLGRLNAFSTAGSILGSALPAFVFIPLIGTKRSFIVFAFLLLLPCLICFIGSKSRKGWTICVLCQMFFVVIGTSFDQSIAPDESEYEAESAYQYLRVHSVGDMRLLSTGLFTYVQSVRADDPGYSYLDIIAALPAFVENEPASILTVGYGGGVLGSMLDERYGEIDAEFVELDPEMVEVARNYFGANPNERVFVDDGRRYLQATDALYDIIAVDAYQDTSIPLNLVTSEFFALCAQRLRPNGYLAVNIAMAGDGENAFCRALGETMRQAFPCVTFARVPGSPSAVFIGSEQPLPFERAMSWFEEYRAMSDAIMTLRENASDAPLGGSVMTDDQSSAELFQLEAYALTMY